MNRLEYINAKKKNFCDSYHSFIEWKQGPGSSPDPLFTLLSPSYDLIMKDRFLFLIRILRKRIVYYFILIICCTLNQCFITESGFHSIHDSYRTPQIHTTSYFP